MNGAVLNACPRNKRNGLRVVVGLMIVGLLSVALGWSASSGAFAAQIGTGAVSVKGPSSELVPGTTVEIRQGNCSGPAVWRTITGSAPAAYGAFGIGLAAGQYCILTLAVPSLYAVPATSLVEMKEGPGNWFTVWLPGPVSGALVAKDAGGNGVNGLSALIQEGPCAAPGGGVWQNTTATSRWSSGGFGISLKPGTYCSTAQSVPAGYDYPAPVETVVSAPGPVWITMWLAATSVRGTTDDVIAINATSMSQFVEFSCSDCVDNVILWALSDAGDRDLLINEIGAYPKGRVIVGFYDLDPIVYTQIAVQARGNWTMRVLDISSARHVSNQASGIGDDVVIFDRGGSVAALSHHGSANFIIWASDQNRGFGSDWAPIVNEIGDYWGRVPMGSPAIVQVSTNGSWEITTG
ncbi:hypothetical protein [Cryobacterium sp. Y11]|uniref:hypothetical protein n=1 Tax=Cryobacterium sp. Y11 TaxID=2045016 RepID=UPI0011B004EE|nr:hypothetical protein [Cryobacterium sp. Y11]